jgi:hypothetical protein
MKNKIEKFFLFLVCIPCLGLGLDIPSQQEQKVHEIMEQIAECRFDPAQHALDSMIAADSKDPLNWMLFMVEITLRQLDYAQTPDSDSFQAAFEKAKETIEVYKKQNGANSFIVTIDGLSHLIAASYNMHHKKYLSGLKLGLAALSLCKEVKKIDSSNVDVDFILGIYNYARAELNRKFLGILFWYSGDKLSGIRSIENCSRNGRIIAQVSDMILQEIYVKESMFEKAAVGIERLSAAYPGNRFVLWTKAKLFDAKKMPAAAAEAYEVLADAYAQIPEAKENYFSTRVLEAKRYHEAGNTGKAAEVCTQMLSVCKGIGNDYCRETEKLLAQIRKNKD